MATRTLLSFLKAGKIGQLVNNKQITPLITRTLATPAASTPNIAENVRKKQQLFQMENEMPIFLKGGPLDQILYRFTVGCCGVGLILIIKNFLDMAAPKKKGK